MFRKFFIKTIIFCGLIGLTLLYFNHKYHQTNYWRSLNDLYKFENMPEKIQMANIGSSHGNYGFNYGKYESGFNCFNFGLNSQEYIYDFNILSQYIDHLDKGAIVYIPVSYFSLYKGSDNSEKYINRYYRILDKQYMTDYNWKNKILYDTLSILTSGKNIGKIVLDNKSIEIVPTSIKVRTPEVFIERGKQRADIHQKYIGDQTVDVEELEYLYKIIDLCYEKELEPILITTPFSEYYNNNFDKNFYAKFYKDISFITEEKQILYLDYSHHPLFQNETDYFLDTDHLNENGAKVFTELLVRATPFINN